VQRIEQALELFTGIDAGRLDEASQQYPAGTLLRTAVDRARRFWEMGTGGSS
jgi:hypothetical protein